MIYVYAYAMYALHARSEGNAACAKAERGGDCGPAARSCGIQPWKNSGGPEIRWFTDMDNPWITLIIHGDLWR